MMTFGNRLFDGELGGWDPYEDDENDSTPTESRNQVRVSAPGPIRAHKSNGAPPRQEYARRCKETVVRDLTRTSWPPSTRTKGNRTDWTPRDLGAAVGAHALSKAGGKVRYVSGGFTCAATYRGGDNPESLRIWTEKGTWADARRPGVGGLARDYAVMVAGYPDLPAFMADWGTPETAPSRPVVPSTAKTTPSTQKGAGELEVSSGGAERVWEAILEANEGAVPWPSSAYLEERGIPSTTEADHALLDVETARALTLPGNLRGFIEGQGSGLVVPLRSMRTNRVGALQVRALGSRRRFSLGKYSDEDGTPRAYGHPAACARARFVLVVEGMTDTLAASAALRDRLDVAVVGAVNDAAVEHHIPRFWAEHGLGARRVVVVPDLDPVDGDRLTPNGNGQRRALAGVQTLARAGIEAEVFRWGAFLLGLPDIEQHIDEVGDLGDVARLFPFTVWAPALAAIAFGEVAA